MTTSTTPVTNEKAFSAIRTAIQSGCNFLNAGEHYGTPEANTQTLLAAYLAKYPEDAEKIVLSVKGAFDFKTMKPDGSPEGIKRSIDNILKDLNGTKSIDIFECARVDPDVPLEVTLQYLQEHYVQPGLIKGIALSEVGEKTIRRAAQITRIAAVEVELSLWSTHIMENGVAKACAELNIPVVAYSPVGKGMLSGAIKSLDDIPKDDFRRHYPRFQPENFAANLELVDRVKELANKRGCTPAQLAINWTRSLSRRPGMPQIIPIPGSTSDVRVQENALAFDLTDDEMRAIEDILATTVVTGGRYPDFIPTDG